MKKITSKKAKKKNRDKEYLRTYWRLLYPKNYADLMVAFRQEDYLVKEAKNDLKEVSFSALLKKKDNGFIYLDINNNVINGMLPLISEDSAKKPPYFDSDGIGAHVSVMSQEETEDLDIKEIGDEIEFKLGDVYSTNPASWDEMKKVWFIEIDAPKLKEIRKKYDLPETYKDMGHNFHITIGTQKV